MTKFIETLSTAPESAREAWAKQFAATVCDDGSALPVRVPLLRDVLLPVLTEGVLACEPGCARWLASFASMFAQAPPNRLPDNLRNPIGLLEEALRLDPRDAHARSRLVQLLTNYLRYTLHELPAGVLFGHNGATLDQCADLQRTLAEFEAHLRELGQTAEYAELVDGCRFHYRAYAEYLAAAPRPRGYQAYLRGVGADAVYDVPPTGTAPAATRSDSNP